MSTTPEVTCPQAPQCAENQRLLMECQAKLHQCQSLLEQQESRNQFLRERVRLLEEELLAKKEELAISQSTCEELRNRLKREQHQCSQLKAALERCIDVPTTIATPPPKADPDPIPETSWTDVEAISFREEEKPQPTPRPPTDRRSPSPLIRRDREKHLSSFAAVELPRFPKLPKPQS
ncbi:MAG: hypothetical protein RMK91_02190 [Pseudanabaenaceae cyanobacterium SKYGB_i_bin29]|nr:hypothetical protein [Pseudanabaenaceae cyanobacterium SKYG29]MDW8420655.1 hypothetical protein [Pseudanabaenaceae cyanobacterium SKYGB_i_bin29]